MTCSLDWVPQIRKYKEDVLCQNNTCIEKLPSVTTNKINGQMKWIKHLQGITHPAAHLALPSYSQPHEYFQPEPSWSPQ